MKNLDLLFSFDLWAQEHFSGCRRLRTHYIKHSSIMQAMSIFKYHSVKVYIWRTIFRIFGSIHFCFQRKMLTLPAKMFSKFKWPQRTGSLCQYSWLAPIMYGMYTSLLLTSLSFKLAFNTKGRKQWGLVIVNVRRIVAFALILHSSVFFEIFECMYVCMLCSNN